MCEERRRAAPRQGAQYMQRRRMGPESEEVAAGNRFSAGQRVFAAPLASQQYQRAGDDRQQFHDDAEFTEPHVEQRQQSCQDQPDAEQEHAEILRYSHSHKCLRRYDVLA